MASYDSVSSDWRHDPESDPPGDPHVFLCPRGCRGTPIFARRGDTLARIANSLGIPISVLIACNPQIPGANFPLVAGQQVCTPNAVAGLELPCSVVLNRVSPLPGSDARGVALVFSAVGVGQGTTGITVAAFALGNPGNFGGFNAFAAVVVTPTRTFRFRLFPTPENAPTWAATQTGIRVPLTSNTRIQVRAFNTVTGDLGPIILSGTLTNCRGEVL